MNMKAAFMLVSLLCFAVAEEKKELQPAQAPSAPSVPRVAEKVDREVPEIMKNRHVPGVALLVVQNDRIVLSRGYGYADLETRKAVDPEKTIFRAGSVSKLLTATAVMQLAEQKRQRQLLFLGTGALEGLPWYETPKALLVQAIAFALVFLPLGLIWPLGILLRRRPFSSSYQRNLPPGRLLASVTGLLIIFFLAGYTALFLQIDHYWQIMRNEFPWTWMTRLSVLPLITSAVSPGLPVYAAAAWIRKRGTGIGRAYITRSWPFLR